MAIVLEPKGKRVIGFELSGVYYIDIDGKQTLAIYEADHFTLHNGPIDSFHHVNSRYGTAKNIYIEE